MSRPARLAAALLANVVVAVAVTGLATRSGMTPEAAGITALLAVVPLVLWTARRNVNGLDRSLSGLDDGLRALRDADFSMRLAAGGGDRVANLKETYNEVADALRAQRSDVYQKELLLDTILQRTPMAVLLLGGTGRVLFANPAARELFAAGKRLDGERFDGIIGRLAPPMRDALEGDGDGIVSLASADQIETFHVSQRRFRLNTLEHRLVMVERLTGELRKQEIAVWKNAIRVINHELNNTIAPISSLVHSARLAHDRPDRRHQLGDIYETIEERLSFLRTFLDSYAQFARIPLPKKEIRSWEEVIADVRALYAFRVEGDARQKARFDGMQIQQVLINLVKNAHESGSDPSEVIVSLQRGVEGVLLRVMDRGRGMTDEVMRQALVPFYTTRPGGSGLGLALSSEIVEAHGGQLRLQAREGGGTIVSCFLPR